MVINRGVLYALVRDTWVGSVPENATYVWFDDVSTYSNEYINLIAR